MADVMLTRGVPKHIRSDYGAEMTAKIVRSWFATLGANTLYIDTVRPHSSLGYRPPAPETFNPMPLTLDQVAQMQ